MNNQQKKVPLLNKVAYGVGTGGGCVFNQIAAAFLLQYYTDTALIGAGAVATMFLVCRILDGVSDFVMGGIVDKTHTKFGKARPWLIASAPLTLLGIVLLMNVPLGMSEGGKLAYAYITYIFMNCIVYTIYGISNTALLPLMTRNANESTMLATFSAIGNNLIGMLAGIAITPLVINFGWTVSSVVLGGAACVQMGYKRSRCSVGDMMIPPTAAVNGSPHFLHINLSHLSKSPLLYSELFLSSFYHTHKYDCNDKFHCFSSNRDFSGPPCK